MIYKCNKCGSEDVRRQVSFLLNPNDTDSDIGETMALSNWAWDDFEWCADCQDATILEEAEENQESD